VNKKSEWMKKIDIISLANVLKKSKISLLRKLGYNNDGVYVMLEDGERLLDKYTLEPVRIDNMMILPTPRGPIILNNDIFSLMEYLEEYKIEILT